MAIRNVVFYFGSECIVLWNIGMNLGTALEQEGFKEICRLITLPLMYLVGWSFWLLVLISVCRDALLPSNFTDAKLPSSAANAKGAARDRSRLVWGNSVVR